MNPAFDVSTNYGIDKSRKERELFLLLTTVRKEKKSKSLQREIQIRINYPWVFFSPSFCRWTFKCSQKWKVKFSNISMSNDIQHLSLFHINTSHKSQWFPKVDFQIQKKVRFSTTVTESHNFFCVVIRTENKSCHLFRGCHTENFPPQSVSVDWHRTQMHRILLCHSFLFMQEPCH